MPNDGWEDGFDAIDNDFCYKFVTGIAKANGSIVFKSMRVWAFGDDEGGVIMGRHLGLAKSHLPETSGFVAYNGSIYGFGHILRDVEVSEEVGNVGVELILVLKKVPSIILNRGDAVSSSPTYG
ncbi:hypothetical protein KY290_027879 [Solanum tuberosum]|uniref:Uncharacterized protein n=1 Tax=Solanum tuberosum TaxID=4113 RepID=A0ABQ7UGE1_SOLTU|nr:hypothetical protein KY290_027879 [Solanum tuberosum]